MSADDWFDQVGRPIVIATHPRSGTHLTIDLLRKQFEACQGWLWFGETLHHLYLNLDRLNVHTTPSISIDKALNILKRADTPLVKTHSLPALPDFKGQKKELATRLLKRANICYVVRDGRDVLCSAHQWRMESSRHARVPLSKFMRQEVRGMSRVAVWAEHVQTWSSRPGVHVLRFEDIVNSPAETVQRFANWLDLEPVNEQPWLPKKLKGGGRLADYWRRITREFESTAIAGRYKGQEPLNWKTHFTPEDHSFFEAEAGPVLKKYGYI